MRLQHRMWAFERVGWWLLCVAVAAALLGLFGNGPLSLATASSADGSVVVRYERFWRVQSPTRLRVELVGAPGEPRARLWLDGDYLDALSVSNVMPRPESVQAGADGTVFVFALNRSATRVTVSFQVEAERAWLTHGSFRLEGGEPAFIRQIFFP